MNEEWNLEVLYKGLDDPAYEADMAACGEFGERLAELLAKSSVTAQSGTGEWKTFVEEALLLLEQRSELFYKVGNYQTLCLSVNTEDGVMRAQQNRLMKLYADTTALEVAVYRILGGIPDIDAVAAQSEVAAEYASLLRENKKEMAHMLSDGEEAMISAMDMTGGAAWGDLQSYLTSTVKVDYGGGEVTLSEIRNLAYSPDAAVRKAAYEAELACYAKIEAPVAFAVNNIKNQVAMLCGKKGYESPLAMTLEKSRMDRKTLDAMMAAIGEYLPVFHKYLRKKASLLGYEGGLPWYELFAPLGEAEKTYSIEEAKECLMSCFSSFAPDMAELVREAFEDGWIDFYPRKGKTGGAFCAGVTHLKQSRILTNYDGTFGAADTLAHELGHAYHNRQLEGERPMNQDYPMPVAETASTFNEIHLGQYALKNASAGERLNLLDSDLREKTQCIIDIYSRYLFETAVFEQCRTKFLMPEDLKELMADAQKKAYGDGLDEAFYHPYMWVCKSHYYSSQLSFYNFPYAFGNLFAEGLYSLYRKEGDSFVGKYKEMLRLTPKNSIEEDGAMLGIDLTKKEFWRDSLALMAEEIEEFCQL